MRWTPAGLSQPLNDLARAVERQFAPRLPDRPSRLLGVAQAKLTDDLAADNPLALVINTDTNKLAIAVLVAGAWTWRNYDGSAL